jgi:hypothetical protein
LTTITWLVLAGFLGWGLWKIRAGQTAFGIALIVITLLAWPVWQWARPHVVYAAITGTEVKRVDHDSNDRTPSRDVRYIYANDGRDRQFRNEDSWLWLKVNSDSTFGRAKRLEDTKDRAWIVYYGWRSNLFSWHPNVLSLTERFPFVSTVRMIIFYGLSLVLWGGIAWLASRFGQRSARSSTAS